MIIYFVLLALFVYGVNAQSWSSEVLITSTNTAANDFLGSAVAVSGNKLVAGAYGYSTGGGAFTYVLNGSTWENEQILIPPGLASGDQLGRGVEVDGNRLAIGAPNDDTHVSNGGAVYTYNWNGDEWVFGQKIAPSDVSTTSAFGKTISISGTRMVIGASSDSSTANQAGSAYTYTWNGTGWDFLEKLEPTVSVTTTEFHNFGSSVSISGDKMVIGSQGSDHVVNSGGVIYTYQWGGSSWGSPTKSAYSGLQVGDIYGASLALSGDKLVVGTRTDGVSGDEGGVYSYVWDGSAWGSETFITPSAGLDQNDYFGYTLSMDGDVLVVGAYGDDDGGDSAGAVYLYAWNGTAWKTETKTLFSAPAVNQLFGFYVDTDGSNVVVGVDRYSGDGITNEGVIAIYPYVPPITIEVGTAKVQYNVKNGTTRDQVTQTAITDIKSKHTDITFTIKSTESSVFPSELYNDVGDATLFKDSVAKARGCYPDCTVTVDTNRRVLQSSGSIPITITFELTETAYNELVASGNNLDDPAFITDMATELGVNASDVSVIVVDGEVVLEITYSLEETDDPTGADDIAALQEIQASLNNATQVLVTELGTNDDAVTTIALDLCGTRDCSGRGTCDTATGVCDCTGNWWGINCETACSCNNGGECVGVLCQCVYPYYGLKCESDKSTVCDTCN